MGNDRRRIKGRAESGSFVQLPKDVITSKQFAALPARAVKLLVDLFSQYNGFNNGGLYMEWKLMRAKGWKSKDTLNEARKDLLEAGFIEKTRQGGKNLRSCYAVTWLGVNESKKRLDYGADPVPTNAWKKFKAPVRNPNQASPNIVPMNPHRKEAKPHTGLKSVPRAANR